MGSPVYIFPDGRAGAGLVCLRIAVAGSGLAIVSSAEIDSGWRLAYCLALAAPIAAGVLTRALAGFGAVVLLFALSRTVSMEALGVHMACSLAVALTGAGAYSVDSAMFGRRQIVVPNIDRRL